MKHDYIPSLDGLRAISVSLVLLFHVNVTGFSGGFIGVDMFFAISGYIITKNMFGAIEAGKFKLTSFYGNRLARLLPALIATVLVSMLVGTQILTDEEMRALARESVFSLASLSNIYFWSQTGYFDASSLTKPLLHTWSLSVEEQFYLIWPVLLLTCTKLISRKALAALLIGISAISLSAAVAMNGSSPATVFYLTPFRIVEFSAGAILAIYRRHSRERIVAWMMPLGLIILIGLGCFADKVSSSVSMAAVSLAAMMILYGIEDQRASQYLGSRPLVWLGTISYSVYLVHWPIIVFWRIQNYREPTGYEQLLLVAGSICLGAILNTLIEKRFRFKRDTPSITRHRTQIGVLASLIGCLVIAASYTTAEQASNVQDTFGYPNKDTLMSARNAAVRYGVCDLHPPHEFKSYNADLCTKGHTGRPLFLVIGDSYAADVWLALTSSYPEFEFAQATSAGCRLSDPESEDKYAYPACKELNHYRMQTLINEPRYEGIIIAANWTDYGIEQFKVVRSFIEQANDNIIVFGQRARFTANLDRIEQTVAASPATAMVSDYLDPENQDEAIRSAIPGNAKFYQLLSIQCNRHCPTRNVAGRPLYADERHWSVEGAEFFGNLIRRNYPDLLAAQKPEDVGAAVN